MILPFAKKNKGKVLKIIEKKIISKKPQQDHMAIGSFGLKKQVIFLYMS